MEERLSHADGSDGTRPAAAGDCPECGAVLLHTNGCWLCLQCGYSPCL